jgi:RimJ/RimL family protein N-acetyltransferase
VPTRDELLWWLQDGEAGFEKDQAWEYFIFEIESNELVGMAGLNNSRVAAGAIEISYWIRSDRTGRGYATEATRALVDNVLANVEEITSIEIHMDAANHASASIPQKLGFSLLREEYSERRAIAHTGRDQVWRLRRSR